MRLDLYLASKYSSHACANCRVLVQAWSNVKYILWSFFPPMTRRIARYMSMAHTLGLPRKWFPRDNQTNQNNWSDTRLHLTGWRWHGVDTGTFPVSHQSPCFRLVNRGGALNTETPNRRSASRRIDRLKRSVLANLTRIKYTSKKRIGCSAS